VAETVRQRDRDRLAVNVKDVEVYGSSNYDTCLVRKRLAIEVDLKLRTSESHLRERQPRMSEQEP
jgi:hypothetical protein